MTNIQSQLQALANLVSQPKVQAAASALSTATSPVQVAQLSSTALLLTQNNRQVSIPLEQVKGKLVQGKQYQANLLQAQSGAAQVDSILRLFDTKSPQAKALPLPIAQSLLQLPVQTLFASQLKNNGSVSVTAQVTQILANRISLTIQGQKIDVTADKIPPGLKPGQSVQVLLRQSPQGGLQVTLLQPKQNLSLPVALNHANTAPLNQAISSSLKEVTAGKQSLTNILDQHKSGPIAKQVQALSQHLEQGGTSQVKLVADKQGKLFIPPLPQATAVIKSAQQDSVRQLGVPVESQKTPPSSAVASGNQVSASQATTAPPLSPVQKGIQQLLRQLTPLSESPSVTLQKLDNILQDPILSQNSELKKLLTQIQQQLKQALPQGKDSDHLLLKQLLTQPGLSMTPAQIVSPPASHGFMAGLMAMLQMSLGARLARQQPAQTDNLVQLLKGMMGPAKAAPTKKGLSDMQQLDQKHQLLRELGKAMAGHQAAKVSNAEQQLQGQDSFYYTLPLGVGQDRKDIELLIRREPEKQDGGKNKKMTGNHWKLNMKLDIGDLGQLLAKASLKDKSVDLDFYASNQQTLEQVLNFVPLLKRRFVELGIEVGHNRCQLGKIPASLQHTPYQLFEAKV